jgi:hypothetical protein
MRLIPGPAGHVDLSAFNDDNENDGDDCDNNEADASYGLSRRRVDSSMHAVKEVFLSVSYQRSYAWWCDMIITSCLFVEIMEHYGQHTRTRWVSEGSDYMDVWVSEEWLYGCMSESVRSDVCHVTVDWWWMDIWMDR